MKYGVISYKRPMREGSKHNLNLGDPIQSYALRKLYEKMSIDENNIVEINRYNAKSYNGEYTILPFSCFNMISNQYMHEYDSLPPSPKIIPVYISFHLHSRVISKEILESLRAYQPIGCRDEETMINLRRHGIVAYLSGCITATLPKREVEPKVPKTFFVDVIPELLKYAPEELKENAEFITHMPPFERTSNDQYLTDDEFENFYNNGIYQLERYKNEATLVVTSRLHAAVPCIAMGIPVILASANFDGRFSWIEKFVYPYTLEEFDKIDWNPRPIEYEEEKQRLINMFINRIQKTYIENKEIYDISSFYENRDKINYNTKILNMLKKLGFTNDTNIKYALWGIIPSTLTIKNVISDNFPNWELVSVIDQNITGTFEGIEIKNASAINNQDENIIYFVVPNAAHKFASDYLNKLDRRYILF